VTSHQLKQIKLLKALLSDIKSNEKAFLRNRDEATFSDINLDKGDRIQDFYTELPLWFEDSIDKAIWGVKNLIQQIDIHKNEIIDEIIEDEEDKQREEYYKDSRIESTCWDLLISISNKREPKKFDNVIIEPPTSD